MAKPPRKSGVYVLKFVASGMVYIGASFDIHGRFREHINRLKRGDHHSPRVQSAWDVDGGASLAASLKEIQVETPEALQELEERLLKHWVGRVGWHRILNTSGFPVAIQRRVSASLRADRERAASDVQNASVSALPGVGARRTP